MSGRPSVVLFDFGGTLDADGVAWKDRFFQVWREEVEDVSPVRFDRAFFDADDALVGRVPRDLSLSKTAERLGGGIAAALGSEASAGDRASRRFARESLDVLRSRGDLLDFLASTYRLGVVSNFYGNLAAACEEAGIARHFGTAIDSADVGYFKPDPRIFRAALDALNAGPDEAVFVGDSTRRDMSGARELGMRHVLLCPKAGETGCCPGDPVIARLEELREVLA